MAERAVHVEKSGFALESRGHGGGDLQHPKKAETIYEGVQGKTNLGGGKLWWEECSRMMKGKKITTKLGWRINRGNRGGEIEAQFNLGKGRLTGRKEGIVKAF